MHMHSYDAQMGTACHTTMLMLMPMHMYMHMHSYDAQMGTAYHKIVPICEPGNPLYNRFTSFDWRCTIQPEPADPDGKIVYDLLPINETLGYCYGDACVVATNAIDQYRSFLHRFSWFRTKVVHTVLGGQCPFDSEGQFESTLISLHRELSTVLDALRIAIPGLQPTCVAPSRQGDIAIRDMWADAVRIARFEGRLAYPSGPPPGPPPGPEPLEQYTPQHGRQASAAHEVIEGVAEDVLWRQARSTQCPLPNESQMPFGMQLHLVGEFLVTNAALLTGLAPCMVMLIGACALWWWPRRPSTTVPRWRPLRVGRPSKHGTSAARKLRPQLVPTVADPEEDSQHRSTRGKIRSRWDSPP